MSTFQEECDKVELAPEQDVYHYLMFVVPIESAKREEARLNNTRSPGLWGTLLAYAIVIMSVGVQITMLWAIWGSIVLGDIDWQLSVYQEIGGCNKGGSLCMKDPKSQEYTCAPPSVQLATRWEELDTDGDGVWTRQEVKAQQDALRCKYAVNPVEVFDVFSKMAVGRESVLWIHPDVRAGKAIPKPYFDFAAGDIIHCTYRTTDMCPNLLMRGTWDAPLKFNTSPRVGNTIDTALEYCMNLLKPGGYCERLLPSTYAVWKKSSADQCSGPGYSKVTYEHPTNGKTKSLLAVDYSSREDFKRDHKDQLFHIFKMCTVGIYLMAMFLELKSIIVFTNAVFTFPDADSCTRNKLKPVTIHENPQGKGAGAYTINGISKCHRWTMALVVLVRLLMLGMLTVVGLMFLEKTMSVLDLILNGLGLLFIVGISQIMCVQIVNQSLRAEMAKIEPMQIPMLGSRWLNRNPAFKDFLWMCLLIFGIMVSCATYKAVVIDPTSDALTCACLSEGKSCREARLFDTTFWSGYWNEKVPAVFEAVANIKAKYHADHASASAASPPSSDASAVLVKHNRKKHSRHHRMMLNAQHHELSLLNLDEHVTNKTFGILTHSNETSQSRSVAANVTRSRGLQVRARG